MRRLLLGGGLLALYLLHNDFWNWQRPDLVLGLPRGLLYHLFYCVGVAAFMVLLLRFSAPAEPPS